MRALQTAVLAIVDALIDGSRPPLEALNALAAREPAIYALERRPGGKLHARLRPKRASAAATLLVAAIRELSELEPSRLRRCARPEVHAGVLRRHSFRHAALARRTPVRAARAATTSPRRVEDRSH